MFPGNIIPNDLVLEDVPWHEKLKLSESIYSVSQLPRYRNGLHGDAIILNQAAFSDIQIKSTGGHSVYGNAGSLSLVPVTPGPR